MDTVSQFEALAGQWSEHCREVAMSSNPADSLRHPAYRQLVQLGPAIVPQIMARIAEDDLVPWESVLEEITKVRFVDDPTNFNPQEVLQKRLKWWESARGTPSG